jgi:hypothetical protein
VFASGQRDLASVKHVRLRLVPHLRHRDLHGSALHCVHHLRVRPLVLIQARKTPMPQTVAPDSQYLVQLSQVYLALQVCC